MVFARARGAVRFGAVAAAVLISGGVAALPAQAAGGDHFAALVSASDLTLLPQSSGAQAQRFHQVGLVIMGETAPLTGVAVTVDASGATGVAELSLGKGCSFTDAAKLHERCVVGTVDTIAELEVGLRSASGAALGAKGTVRFAVTAAHATVDPDNPPLTTAVTVGSGPDLAVGTLPTVLDVRSGGPSPVDPTVQNVGDQDATGGLTLVLGTAGGNFTLGGNYSNCRYDNGAGSVVCHFDTVIKPGEAYRLSTPVPLTADRNAVGADALLYGWDVKGGLVEQQLGGGGKPGTGAPLTLVPAGPSISARAKADINYDNNVGVSELRLVTKDDVAVVAPHTITGTVGHTVPATFGVRNVGSVPTHVLAGSPGITAGVVVVVPKGVSVASLPAGCELISPDAASSVAGTTGHLRGLLAEGHFGAHALAPSAAAGDPSALDGTPYACAVRHVLKPGQQAVFAFQLKPTRVLRKAPGLAIAVGAPTDRNPDDNVAGFTVTATGSTTTPTATPTHAATPSASPSSPSGGLAHTGGGSSALPLAAAGAGAIVLGAGAVLLTRRRRKVDSRS
ncbi:LPXTG cell wall anchor domain-containing protein [Streptacidiphilus jiangxiensis]|uniref:LPXTG-motif cell wall anchor domain-containing protein n=1 Tax=Streptacidiphilus jiangxiensis TaxID=235985 RepID=A0A1H7Q195_STRJI|nr:LPXTG cell wall anchor domain-containing protein [Streptacidiphilus jiangxiensis]SEL41484.1 LPXTG-motif cell wall anchor domain-containing protein [Streptacidiphilus jiangxiensis]